MESKSMRSVKVSSETGHIVIEQDQWDDSLESYVGHRVEITFDQVPMIVDWLYQLSGVARDTSGARKGDQIATMAHLFRRLEKHGAGGPSDIGSRIEGIRVALEWASGESDLSPDEWLHE
jgi:hypothetical protein